jgi:hypothetical protein
MKTVALPESDKFFDCCFSGCCFLSMGLFEADFRTAPGAIVGVVVVVLIAVDVVGVFLAGVVAAGIFLAVEIFSFPFSLLTASSSLDTTGSEKLARLKWSNSGGKRLVPGKNGVFKLQ